MQTSAAPFATSLRPVTRRARGWERGIVARLAWTDAGAILAAVAASQLLRFGLDGSHVDLRDSGAVSYTGVSLVLVVGWFAALGLLGSRDERIIGIGSAEYIRVIDASLRLFGVLAVIAFVLKIDLARGYVLASLPIGLVLLLLGRWLWRQWLRVRRSAGLYATRVLLLGSSSSVQAIARDLLRAPQSGFVVAGACVPGSTAGRVPGTEIPLSSDADVVAAMAAVDADTVVVTGGDAFPPQAVRELSWSLEPGRQHLLVAPSLTDVGGPRIHMRPVAGLPLLHVETPTYDGAKLFAKRTFDILVASALLVALAPLMAVIALVVRLDSPGPVLFRQERVGLRGGSFPMLKFRTMVVDAEERLAELHDRERTEGNVVMFKMRHDPRITRVGRLLRRYSLDELPQIVNVLRGQMSMVGPRPPIDREVQGYERHVHRRFLVKPGITGLWQVSGRSDLSWDDTVRLDLYYVENWSMTGDLVILARTARAVLAREGAY